MLSIYESMVIKSFQNYIKQCAQELNLSYDVLVSPYRGHSYCIARYIIWTNLWNNGLTLEQIGSLFNRDHSSITQGIAKINQYKASLDRATIKYIELVESSIKKIEIEACNEVVSIVE